jgi:hypothetical protein
VRRFVTDLVDYNDTPPPLPTYQTTWMRVGTTDYGWCVEGADLHVVHIPTAEAMRVEIARIPWLVKTLVTKAKRGEVVEWKGEVNPTPPPVEPT